MSTDTALPTGEQPQAGEQQSTEQPADHLQQTDGADAQEGQQTSEDQQKELTPEQLEIRRLRKNESRLLRQRGRDREVIESLRRSAPNVALPEQHGAGTNGAEQDEDQPVQLTRKQLEAMVTERAQKLAPQIKQEQAVEEHRRGVAQGLAKKWGQEKFEAVTSDLDDALGGLADQHGRFKPAADAILESVDPAALIEYLADPDNADEAEALGRMSPTQAGRAVAKLEAKLQAKAADDKANDKPQPSNAPKPLERIKGGGSGGPPDPSSDGYMAWKMKQLSGR